MLAAAQADGSHKDKHGERNEAASAAATATAAATAASAAAATAAAAAATATSAAAAAVSTAAAAAVVPAEEGFVSDSVRLAIADVDVKQAVSILMEGRYLLKYCKYSFVKVFVV